MGKYIINGGRKIYGAINIPGSKNAILPILAATILNSGESIINNCPQITDVFNAINILKKMGCRAELKNNSLIVNSKNLDSYEIPKNLAQNMRSSIIFLGSLLARSGKAKISYPGGCKLGARPIDLHLKAFKKLGVNIIQESDYILCEAKNITGTEIKLEFPSVGATENIMLLATKAKGITVITNAAMEPEIIDLQNFLISIGAKVSGAETGKIIIVGNQNLHDTNYTVISDRIVAGTFLTAAAITSGEILIENVNPKHLSGIVHELSKTGCTIKNYEERVFLKAPKNLKSIDQLITKPYPGFPTDMQAQFMSLLAIANGTSLINETIFESRNHHINELKQMGADIMLSNNGRTSIINGVETLKSTIVTSKDLRGGAALILAGLAAEGKTIVCDNGHILRGYEKIDKSLNSLGAKIKFIQ